MHVHINITYYTVKCSFVLIITNRNTVITLTFSNESLTCYCNDLNRLSNLNYDTINTTMEAKYKNNNLRIYCNNTNASLFLSCGYIQN